MYRHLVIGNINIDVYLRLPRMPGPDEAVRTDEAYIGPGGAASNYSVAVSRLGHRACLAACTGDHPLSELVLRGLEEAGVDLSLVRRIRGELPGIVFIAVYGGGERSMMAYRGANRFLSPSVVPGDLGSYDIAYFASVDPGILLGASDALESARLVGYDPGGEALRSPGPVLRAARLADLLFINRRELEALTGLHEPSAARRLLRGRLKAVLVKYGAKGTYLVTRDRVLFQEAYRHGEAVDTTGAGDSFAAAFNTYLLETGSYEEALKAGIVAAGIKVTRKGAQSSPTRRELEEALERLEGLHING